MRYKITAVSDGLFIGFGVFFTSFIVFTSFAGLTATWICSLLMGLLAAIFGVWFLNNRRGKKYLSLAEEPKKENLLFHLALYGKDEDFMKLFDAFGKTVFKTPNGLYLKEADGYIYPCFDFDGLTKNRIAEIYVKSGNKKAYLFAPSYDENVKAFAKSFGDKFCFFDGNDVYDLFKKAEMLPPEKEIIKPPKKEKFKVLLKTVFHRKRAPRYFLFGVTFLLFSFLVPFKLYYIIFGAVMMTLALVSVFFASAAPEKKFWEG